MTIVSENNKSDLNYSKYKYNIRNSTITIKRWNTKLPTTYIILYVQWKGFASENLK